MISKYLPFIELVEFLSGMFSNLIFSASKSLSQNSASKLNVYKRTRNLLYMFEALKLQSEVQIIKRITSTLRLFFRGQKKHGQSCCCTFQNWQFDWPPISVVLQSLQQDIFQNIKQWSFKDYKKIPLSIRPTTVGSERITKTSK